MPISARRRRDSPPRCPALRSWRRFNHSACRALPRRAKSSRWIPAWCGRWLGERAVCSAWTCSNTTTQFLPLLAGPVPADYKLGPGDQLVLILTGDVELAYTLQVTREGFILI